MLVLGRKLGEGITIFDEQGNSLIEVTVVNLEHGRVKLGIKADRSMPVHRNEVIPRIRGDQLRRAA